MVNEEKVVFLTKLQDLCGTIKEGTAYLAAHPSDTQIRSSIQAGLAALKANMDSYGLASNISWAKFNTLYTGSSRDVGKLSETSKRLDSAVAEAVAKALSDEIKDDAHITQSVAEKIFHFFDEAPHTCPTIYQLLFGTCKKCDLSAPMQAFEYTLKAFEEQPNILKNVPHDNFESGYEYHPSEQRTFDRCPICGGEGVPYYRSFSYRMKNFCEPHLPVKLWMKCSGCKNLYTWKYPEEWLAWSESHKMIKPNPSNYLTALGPGNARIFSTWSNILNKLSSYAEGNTLLEVGIGQGELLAVALEMGYAVDAVEISTEVAQNVADILNISIWNGDFLNYTADKTYSIIIMGDVIEHVLDPKRALQNAYRLLGDTGVLWLSTPNFESSFSRMRKFDDPMWLEAQHITYFSFQGISALIQDCGFEVKEYTTSNRYNGSMELVLTKKHRAAQPPAMGGLPH